MAARSLLCRANASATRKWYKAEIRKYVLVQNRWRQRQAVQELHGLRAEAKSATKFKEISYQLENKVVELTQNLQKRVVENRELSSKVSNLEQQLLSWQGKHEEAHTRSKTLETELAKPTVPTSQFEALVAAKAETDAKIRDAIKRVADQEKEIARLADELQQQVQESEGRQLAVDSAVAKNMEDANTISSLRTELTSLKEHVSRSNALHALTKGQNGQREPPSPTQANGLRSFEHTNAADRLPSAPSTRRRVRRHSTTGTGAISHQRNLSHDEIMAIKKNNASNRAVSVMFPQNGMQRSRDSQGLPMINDSTGDEIARLLEDEVGLEEDVLVGLISSLKIPSPSLHNPPLAKEILFPAHLISCTANEMWKVHMIPDSERFLANVMQAIQTFVMVSVFDGVCPWGSKR